MVKTGNHRFCDIEHGDWVRIPDNHAVIKPFKVLEAHAIGSHVNLKVEESGTAHRWIYGRPAWDFVDLVMCEYTSCSEPGKGYCHECGKEGCPNQGLMAYLCKPHLMGWEWVVPV